jgi:hypothetical protein
VEATRKKNALQAKAVEAYLAELEKKAAGQEYKSSRTICKEFMAMNFKDTQNFIKLNHVTIHNHAAGKPTRAQSNGKKSWLTPEESKVVIDYIVECGLQGFGLSHRRLKEHVDEILREKLGEAFREEGVGKKWTHRFIEKNSDRIKMAWTTALEEKRGQAVNPNMAGAWNGLYGPALIKYEIKAHNLYGSDEIGVAGTSGQRERVMGSRKKGLHYQQVGGDRDNTTVIVTICADGSALPPARDLQVPGISSEVEAK